MPNEHPPVLKTDLEVVRDYIVMACVRAPQTALSIDEAYELTEAMQRIDDRLDAIEERFVRIEERLHLDK